MECALMARWRSRNEGDGEASRGTILACMGPYLGQRRQISIYKSKYQTEVFRSQI